MVVEKLDRVRLVRPLLPDAPLYMEVTETRERRFGDNRRVWCLRGKTNTETVQWHATLGSLMDGTEKWTERQGFRPRCWSLATPGSTTLALPPTVVSPAVERHCVSLSVSDLREISDEDLEEAGVHPHLSARKQALDQFIFCDAVSCLLFNDAVHRREPTLWECASFLHTRWNDGPRLRAGHALDLDISTGLESRGARPVSQRTDDTGLHMTYHVLCEAEHCIRVCNVYVFDKAGRACWDAYYFLF